MNQQNQNIQNILNHSIPGYHRYCLDGQPRLCFVSRNLCDLLGVSPEELGREGEDSYAQFVHPEDRQAYDRFLQSLGREEDSRTCQYRLTRQDGTILHVSDTVTVCTENGRRMADSVLTDVTGLKQENRNLQFLNETIPCGFLKYTCEKNPKVTYINDRMKAFLRCPEQGTAGYEDLELYMQNMFLLIPPEERRRFSLYLQSVSRSGAPIAGEMTVLRCDGTRARLFGWVTKCVNDQGQEEYQSACMDVTQRYIQRREQETRRYLEALTDVYDKIFEYDLGNHTVKCLHGQSSPMFRWIENIPMQMEEATDKWIMATVFEEDRMAVRDFFETFYQSQFRAQDTPPVIRYRALSSGGSLKTYSGLFVKLHGSISLFCCRSVPDLAEADSLRHENSALKGINENMQQLVMQFTEGIAAFEVIDDVVTPLYASDNVCQFFGVTKEQWLSVMKKRTPIREFVANSQAQYEDFLLLLEKGEAEFTYYDLTAGKQRRIKAICSRKSPEGSAPRYVMLYNLEEKPEKVEKTSKVYIRTFGYFDVFVEDKPIAFRNEKSRELLALLVDRRGGFVSSEEAISYLWEEEPANAVTLARYRKVALRLKNILEEYGIADIVESVNGKRRIVSDRIRCDLYDYLSGKQEYAQLFKGSYLSNYSWGETTLAELTGKHFYGTGE